MKQLNLTLVTLTLLLAGKETGTLRGRVTSMADGKPVAGIIVELERPRFRQTTDEDRGYIIDDIREGTYTALFTVHEFGMLRMDSIKVFSVELPVAVLRSSQSAFRIHSDDFKKWPVSDLNGLLRYLPGIISR